MAFYKISSPCLSKGRNLTRGDNSGKTRNMRHLFFHEESIHEVSRRYLEHEYICTYIHTYGQAETNMPPPLFQSWGHNDLPSGTDMVHFEFANFSMKTNVRGAAGPLL